MHVGHYAEIKQDVDGVIYIDGKAVKTGNEYELDAGSYYLGSDVNQSFITSGNVEIDFKGHKLEGKDYFW